MLSNRFDLCGRRIPATVISAPQKMEIHTEYKGIAIVRAQRKAGVWSQKVIIE